MSKSEKHAKNVRTGKDAAKLISALIEDSVCGNLPPLVVSATCNATGKLLKNFELRMKYGRRLNDDDKQKDIDLIDA